MHTQFRGKTTQSFIYDEDDDDESIIDGRHAQNPNPVAVIIPNQGIPATVTTPAATTARNETTHTIPADVDEAVAVPRARTGTLSAVEKQLQRCR